MIQLYKGRFSIAIYLDSHDQLLTVVDNIQQLADYLEIPKKKAIDLVTHRCSKNKYLKKDSSFIHNNEKCRLYLIDEKEENKMPEIHCLKIRPEFYNMKMRNLKPWEFRTNDRNFQSGDLVHYINVDGTAIPEDENNLYKIIYVYQDAELKIENKVIYTEKPIVPTVEQYHIFAAMHNK